MKLILSALAFCAVLCAQDPAYSNTFPPYSGAGGSTCTGTSGQILYADGSSSNCTGAATGTGVKAALGVNTGSAGAFVVYGGALGTPSGGVMTNLTGLAIGGTPLTTQGDLLYANATPALARLAIGGANTVLTSNGTTISWAAPIACATCVTSAASLTINNLMTGAGGQGSQTVTTASGILSFLGSGTTSALATLLGSTPVYGGNNCGTANQIPYMTSAGVVTCSAAVSYNPTTGTTGGFIVEGPSGDSNGTPYVQFVNRLGTVDVSIGDNLTGISTPRLQGIASNTLSIGGNPNPLYFYMDSTGIGISSTLCFHTSSSSGPSGFDTGLCRSAAGVYEISTSSTPNASGNLKLTPGSTVTGDVTVCWQSGNALTQGATCGTSLEETKRIFGELDHGVDYIMKMRPIVYEQGGNLQFGLGARNLNAIDPLLSLYDAAGNLYNYRDRSVIATLVKALQEQEIRIEQLEAR